MICRINRAGELKNLFAQYGRDDYTFTAYEFMIDFFDEINPDYEIDVIAMCCGIHEYTKSEFLSNFDISVEDGEGIYGVIERHNDNATEQAYLLKNNNILTIY